MSKPIAMSKPIVVSAFVLLLLDAGSAVNAQSSGTAPGGCSEQSAQAAPLNHPKTGADSGPQNTGSTGWTGGKAGGEDGLGGKQSTNAVSNQPETAKGLDPAKDAKTHPSRC
jgi:hypothetical protein